MMLSRVNKYATVELSVIKKIERNSIVFSGKVDQQILQIVQ
jgi:hypothetical protein